MKTLIEKAILVNLLICQWSARKYDRKVTKEVNENHKTDNAGRFNKILIAQENLAKLQKIGNEMRAYHYDNTLPWSNNGDRLLPAENYFQYTAEIARMKSAFDQEVKQFVLGYSAMIEDARINLNGLFNPSDYPTNIQDRFRIAVEMTPIPVSEDLRIGLNDSEVSNLKQEIEKTFNDRFANAQKNIFERIAEQLNRMHEKLNEKDGIFRNSLFDAAKELSELLPRLNVANDPNIDSLCKDLKSLYCDPDHVRKDASLRKEKAKQVDTMLNKLNGFLA